MGGTDDNNRGSVREKTRLRPSVTEEPSSGYSYHDESRVDSVRMSRSPATRSLGAKPANDTAAQHGRSASTGSFAHASSEPAAPTRRALSEPPEVGSWPPMPSVPPDLVGTAEAQRNVDAPASDDEFEGMPTEPPKSALGGAIWEAVPSVIHSSAPAEAGEDGAEEDVRALSGSEPQTQARSALSGLVEDSSEQPRDGSAPLASDSMRARMSRIEAEYSDPRLAKLDPLVERTAWEQLTRELDGTPEPSPLLNLLQIIAKRELVDDKQAAALNREAIRTLAELLDIPEHSPTALLLAKRLLRKNRAPANIRPGTGLSASAVLAGLAVGGGVGWLVTRIFL